MKRAAEITWRTNILSGHVAVRRRAIAILSTPESNDEYEEDGEHHYDGNGGIALVR